MILIKFGLLHRAFSERALGKRRKTVTSEPEIEEGYEQNDNDDEVHLPLPTLSSGCQEGFANILNIGMMALIIINFIIVSIYPIIGYFYH